MVTDEKKKELSELFSNLHEKMMEPMQENDTDKTELESEQDTASQDSIVEQNHESVVLFFSYDIVNSSIYKTINYYGWSSVINSIISSLRTKIKNKISSAEVWRVLGDEIIFIVNIYDAESIPQYINYIYCVLIEFCNSIEDGTFFDTIKSFSDDMVGLMKIENIISLQACAWIAAVTDKNYIANKNDVPYVENMFEIIEERSSIKFYEFIGSDIDAGFRVADNTREKRLALSFELAYILSENQEYKKRLKIITYRKLKGVWNNTAYPIIWYYDRSQHKDNKFSKSFPFDAVEKDEIYLEYYKKRKFHDRMYKDVRYALKKICEDKKLHKKIARIKNIIEKSETKPKKFMNKSKLELHCAVVCYNDKKEILIAKRTELKNGKWEFGCAKAKSNAKLADSIVNEYEQDFGIEIMLCKDETREDKQPEPLAVYEIHNDEEMYEQVHKGIIFLAEIVSGEPKPNEEKHSEVKMISENEIDTLNDDECVTDLKATLKKAFEKIKEKKE